MAPFTAAAHLWWSQSELVKIHYRLFFCQEDYISSRAEVVFVGGESHFPARTNLNVWKNLNFTVIKFHICITIMELSIIFPPPYLFISSILPSLHQDMKLQLTVLSKLIFGFFFYLSWKIFWKILYHILFWFVLFLDITAKCVRHHFCKSHFFLFYLIPHTSSGSLTSSTPRLMYNPRQGQKQKPIGQNEWKSRHSSNKSVVPIVSH